MLKFILSLIITFIAILVFGIFVTMNPYILLFVYLTSIIIIDFNSIGLSEKVSDNSKRFIIMFFLLLHSCFFMIYADIIQLIVLDHDILSIFINIIIAIVITYEVYRDLFIKHYISNIVKNVKST